MNLSMEQKQESGTQRIDGGCQEGGGWEKIGVGGWGQQMQTAKYTIDGETTRSYSIVQGIIFNILW